MPAKNESPRVLVTGASGNVGGAVATALDGTHGEVTAVRASRNRKTVETWEQQGMRAVFLDLDDPETFPAALQGIDRVFLSAGYTSAMNEQGKTLVDTAEDAGSTSSSTWVCSATAVPPTRQRSRSTHFDGRRERRDHGRAPVD
jgi:uncharacterized protein YbjT (DUF2867 family)